MSSAKKGLQGNSSLSAGTRVWTSPTTVKHSRPVEESGFKNAKGIQASKMALTKTGAPSKGQHTIGGQKGAKTSY